MSESRINKVKSNIIFGFASQLIIMIVSIILPRLIIFSLPDEPMRDRISSTRVKNILTTNPIFSEGVTRETTRSVEITQIKNSFVLWLPATEKSATSQAADAVLNDEVDLSDQKILALFNSRMQASDWKLNQRFSTPTYLGYGIDQSFKLNKKNPNSLVFIHQFNQEYKFFQFTQPTISERFGDTYTNNISNKTRYNHLYNKFGVAYKTKSYGDLEFFIDDNNYNYYYNSVVYDALGDITVPNAVSDRINMVGGNYSYLINNVNVRLHASQSISDQSISNIEATVNYKVNEDYNFQFKYQKLNSLPNLNFTLYQSGYVDYNWFNNFKNEKLNQFEFSAQTKWLNVSATYKVINDHLFFDNQTNDITELMVKPVQYDKTINYLSVKANKEIKFWKLALDNTILYQSVDQSDNVVNVPQIVTRNTLYFTDFVFKKAMLLQTGVTFQYFSKYYANDYNPLLGEFYVQNETKIGGFPMFDFFVNARVKQTRIFLKAEHFNSAWTGYDFYSAPNYPYRDFMVRFGLVWNFFK